MPDTTSPNTNEPDAKSGGPKRLIIMGVLCALILGAGFVLGGRLSGGAATAEPAADAAEEEPAEPTIDEIVDLDPLNINLADGHYLRIAIAIGVHHGEEAEEDGGGGHGASDAEAEPSIETAPATDLVLTTFSGRQMPDLSSPEGRERARHDLLDGLVEFYGEDIVTVLFTEFVMQ